MPRRAIVDADLIVFRAGFGAEPTEYKVVHAAETTGEMVSVWFKSAKEAKAYREKQQERGVTCDTEKHTRPEPVANALANARNIVEYISRTLGNPPMTLVLSGDTNFRNDIWQSKEYKGHRKEVKRPTHEQALRKYLRSNWETVISDGEEADDVVGIMVTEDPEGTTCVSADKDLNMIPGFHYNFVKETYYYVTPLEGVRNFYGQLLCGDATDNIPGLPGVGPVKAENHLDASTPEAWGAMALTLYEKAFGADEGKTVMIENAQLLWIRRAPGEIWTPKLMDGYVRAALQHEETNDA